MKILLKYILLGTIALSSNSCSKFLDINPGEVKPLKETYYKTSEDFQNAIAGTYAVFTHGDLFGNRFNGRLGLEVDEGASAYNTDGGATSIGLYENIHSGQDLIARIYGHLFKGVRNASTIINLIDGSEMPAGIERDHIKGQAYFLKSLSYLYLANFFGGVPIIEHEEGITKEVYSISRSSEKEVLEYVIENLKSAAELMKPIEEVGVGVQASKSAAWGILARAYLKLAGEPNNVPEAYAEAAKYAKMVMDIGYHQLNPSYHDVFIKLATDQFDAKEVIFEINFMGNNAPGMEERSGSMQGRSNGISNRAPNPANATGFAGHSEGLLVGTPYLYRLYNNYGGRADFRFDYNLATYWYHSNGNRYNLPAANLSSSYQAFSRFCGKFRRENEVVPGKVWHNMYGPQNISVLRYSDVLLMYAEALIRSNAGDAGKYAEAIGYVNEVRKRSIPVNTVNRELSTVMPSGDAEAEMLYGINNVIIKHIIEERARELCFEGLRKFDLNRWGIFYKRAMAIKEELLSYTHVSNNSTLRMDGLAANNHPATKRYYNAIQPHMNYWPLSAQELSMNPNLVQNEGY